MSRFGASQQGSSSRDVLFGGGAAGRVDDLIDNFSIKNIKLNC